MSALISYGWPGNVRELENTLESLVALNRSGMITPQDLPAKMQVNPEESKAPGELYSDLPSLTELKKRYVAYVLKLATTNKAKAADILGVSRRTLYNILEKYKMPF
jgi:DNA-binding NtrC family response regulator